MCSRQDEFSVVPKKNKSINKECMKCQKPSVFLIGTNGGYCRDCFDKYFVHKFRATIGKSHIMRRGSKVALAYTGGNCSSAALDVLQKSVYKSDQQTQDNTSHKKLRYDIGLIYIDESCINEVDPLYNITSSDTNKHVVELMKKSDLPYHVVKLEKVLGMAYCVDKQIEINFDEETLNEMRMNMKNIFKSIKSLSAKQELLTRLRSRLLAIEAKHLNYDYVVTGESNSRLAITTLCSVVFGRDGNSIQQDCSFSDGHRCNYAGGAHILRPMKDTSAKEIATYNNLNKVPTCFVPNLSTYKSPEACIQTLTESFVTSLAVNFPSTEMTIYKTSEKLKGNTLIGNDVTICGLCHAYITGVSHVDVELDYNGVDLRECTVDDCRCFSSNTSISLFNRWCDVLPPQLNCKQLCYSCTSMLSENL